MLAMEKDKKTTPSLLAGTSLEKALANSKEFFSDEELAQILRRATDQKQASIRAHSYWEEVNKPIQWPRYKAEELMQVFDQKYKAREGVDFVWDEYSNPIIQALCLYFTDDPQFESLGEGFSLQKGILLQGNVGCGKSSVMQAFAENQKQSFKCVACPDISIEFSRKGYEIYPRYVHPTPNPRPSQAFFGHELLGWYFDDLGFETTGKHFGKATNFMSEVIQGIYNNSQLRGKVHFSTNLSADDIQKFYGLRIRSRMRQLFNVIEYDQSAPDRRG